MGSSWYGEGGGGMENEAYGRTNSKLVLVYDIISWTEEGAGKR